MESWSSRIRFLQWGWLCKGCWWTWEWGSGFREYRLFWLPCSYSFNFPVFLSLLIPQSFSSYSSLHLFTFLLPSSSLLLCVFRRTKYSFPSLTSLSVHCSHLAPVTHIQEDSFFTVCFFFPFLALSSRNGSHWKSLRCRNRRESFTLPFHKCQGHLWNETSWK